MCVDPFRAWFWEKGKFYGSEIEVNLWQDWEKEPEPREPFNVWKKKRSSEDTDTKTIEDDDDAEEWKQQDDWVRHWRTLNPRGTVSSMSEEWMIEWTHRRSNLERCREEADRRKLEEAAKEDQKPILERWRRGWRPPVVNWTGFELALSYGRFWLKLIRRPKEDYVEAQARWFTNDHARPLRQTSSDDVPLK